MPSEVSLEVGSLAVDLATAGDVTDVLPLLVLVVTAGAVLAVGTLAPPAPPAGQAVAVLQQGSRDLSVPALLGLGGLRVVGGGPELGVVLVVGGGGPGLEVGLVLVVPGLVVVAALLIVARVVAGVEVAALLAPLGRGSDGQWVRLRADSGQFPTLPAVRTRPLTAGVALAVRGDGVSLVLSLHHRHG